MASSMGVKIGSATENFVSGLGVDLGVAGFSGSDWTGVELQDCFVGSVYPSPSPCLSCSGVEPGLGGRTLKTLQNTTKYIRA